MVFHWILRTHFHRNYESSLKKTVRLTNELETCVGLETILLKEA